MDDADMAEIRAEANLKQAIEASLRPRGPQPNGRCYWCDDIVGDSMRFCGPACRDDYQHHNDRLATRGIVR